MADDWFDQQGTGTEYFSAVPVDGLVTDLQAYQITQLVRSGMPLDQIAAQLGLPLSAIQTSAGNGNNTGQVTDTVTGTTLGTPNQPGGNANESPIQFIQRWQREHDFSPESVNQLRDALQAQYGIGRWGGTSNNEIDINGQKIKFWSEGGNSWYDPAGGTPEGDYNPGGNLSLGNYSAANAPQYQYTPYQQPAPFSFRDYQAGAPFTPPKPEDVLNDPGVQAAMAEGQKALESSASARGTLLTGGTLKDVNKWAQNYALGAYDDAFNRSYQTWAGNEAQRQGDYTTDRNNAYQNYALNLGAGQQGYSLNQNASLAAFDRNLASQNQFWTQGRTSALDQYGQGQDLINNQFRLVDVYRNSSGVPYPYSGSYV